MGNSVHYTQHNLSPNNYHTLLEAMINELDKELLRIKRKEKGCFMFCNPGPTCDLDAFATKVALSFANGTQYPFENLDGTTMATIYMPDLAMREDFRDQLMCLLLKLQECMVESLKNSNNALAQNIVQQAQKEKKPLLREYTRMFKKPITDIAGRTNAETSGSNMKGIFYNRFKVSQSIVKKRLHVSDLKEDTEPWLKGHKITLQVSDIITFSEQITSSILTCLKRAMDDEHIDDREVLETVQNTLEEMKDKETSEFFQLRQNVIEKAVPRILRQARVLYLRYLHDGMAAWKKQGKDESMSLLHTYFTRLEALEAYSVQTAKQSPNDFAVSFEGETFNYSDLATRAEVFDPLPIFTAIGGLLAETTDALQGTKTFVLGIKLKLNGPVHSHGGEGKEALDYHLDWLDPTSDIFKMHLKRARSTQHFYEKVLRVAFVYCVLIHLNDPDFSPVHYFENTILSVFRQGDYEQKVAALQQLQQDIQKSDIEKHLKQMIALLKEFIHHESIGPSRSKFSRVLSIKDSILNKDLDSIVQSNIFFNNVDLKKHEQSVLKHIAIEEAVTNNDTICKLPVSILFEPLYYYPVDTNVEKHFMRYDAKEIETLPIIFAPVDKPEDRKKDDTSSCPPKDAQKSTYVEKYQKTFQDFCRITLYYRHHDEVAYDTEHAFVYRITYQLISYLFIKMLAVHMAGREASTLFLPIICLHVDSEKTDEQNEKLDTETFLHSMMKVLDFMLNQDYLSSSQGFNLNTIEGIMKGTNYMQKTALYSLYNPLPRLFQPSETSINQPPCALDKLAVIVVSTRKCDTNKKTKDEYYATIYGQVIGIERVGNKVRLQILSTFSSNQSANLLYQQPEVVIEQVQRYYQQGYKHFFYIASAPYTRTLNVSDTLNLFFMSEPVIKALRSIHDDIRIYPVFCDKYHIVKRKVTKPADSPESQEEPPHSLYIDDIGDLATVSQDTSKKSLIFFNLFNGVIVNKKSVYNGVMSYSTLLNVYQNDITYDQYIWNDLLSLNTPGTLRAELLELLTLLHFWRNEKDTNSTFKLDPYSSIIGDKPIGKRSLYLNMNGKTWFNGLAFLTEVRSVLRIQKHPKDNSNSKE